MKGLLRTAGRTDLGAWPVVGGLIVIAVVFGSLNERFLSAENLTNLALQMAATGTISLGIIMVILLGEIDLSAGSVSGLSAVAMTILSVHHGWHPLLAVAAALAGAALLGLLHGWMFTKLGMPSFVVTLAGLIGWQGLMLYLLGRGGTINLPFEGLLARLSDTWLPLWAGWLLAALVVAGWTAGSVINRRLRRAADLPVTSGPWLAARLTALAAVLAGAVLVLSADRGVPLLLVLFGALVVGLDLVLRHTVFGRHMYAVGGNAEAARRAGINITRIRLLAFMAASTLAAFGGILAASRLAAVNQSSGGSDTLLMAIAAAVIGGTSLFGGRGRAFAALLGILVIQSITNGMLLLNVDSSVRYMVTAVVLAVAVAIDSLARRGQPR
ncbi:sugar ABC transporter permease [Dactylosporangium matsuzakiense]|uniref:Xylose transport system permease protein XylH n=1 Tax=Dactylosporangium matsuzakiense TaxID=53360 RepID=A0A9W6KU76_9ACTN|nr:sugar ABC transporter permease [Dactylosporangium matsuzakiense]UWZ41261.1 sugar ABC transporter permease [Dactylosporangium matsuzakiense]GLL08191.1 ABC transporter permease [Dactylosporangium matsuzakiense]